ncbi:MAG: helix-turn-helix transcriptional regulator [Bacillota bacterium]|nr:helix-turn-helix transcriptional regulator [Bacillota bacterium]
MNIVKNGVIMFSARLKQIRENSGLSQVDFSQEIGVSVATYNAYETGKQYPRIDVIKKICEKYDVSADWLLDISVQPQVHNWADVVKLVEAITLGASLVYPAYVASNDDMTHLNDCTAIMLPTRAVYEYYRLAESIRMFSDNPYVYEVWKKGAFSSNPLNRPIDLVDWELLHDFSLDQEFHFELGEHI